MQTCGDEPRTSPDGAGDERDPVEPLEVGAKALVVRERDRETGQVDREGAQHNPPAGMDCPCRPGDQRRGACAGDQDVCDADVARNAVNEPNTRSGDDGEARNVAGDRARHQSDRGGSHSELLVVKSEIADEERICRDAEPYGGRLGDPRTERPGTTSPARRGYGQRRRHVKKGRTAGLEGRVSLSQPEVRMADRNPLVVVVAYGKPSRSARRCACWEALTTSASSTTASRTTCAGLQSCMAREYVTPGRNIGFAAAVNVGISQARGAARASPQPGRSRLAGAPSTGLVARVGGQPSPVRGRSFSRGRDRSSAAGRVAGSLAEGRARKGVPAPGGSSVPARRS